MRKLFLPLVLAVVFLQGCSTYTILPDPHFSTKLDFRTDWRRGVNGGYGESSERFNMVLEDSGLYLMTNRGAVYQLNTKDGSSVAPSFMVDSVEHNISSGLYKHGDKLYFSTYDAELIAISVSTKKEVWRKQLTSEVLSDPVVVDGKLAVQTIDGWLTLLDDESGETVWRVKEDVPLLTIRGTSSPIIADGKVIAGFADGQVKAFSLFNGKEMWSFEVGKPEGKYEIERLSDVDGRLLLAGTTLYATAYNGTVSAIDVKTGRLSWQRSIPSVVSTTLFGDDQIVVVDQESKVHALDRKNGTEVWVSEDLVGRDLISPTAVQDYVAVMDRSGFVFLLDKEGKVAGYRIADHLLPSGSRMVSKGKQLFILTRNEQVTALTF